ncbi:hypothetical protein [Microbacterium sp. KR10-403]|uniref:hypothetical protein n=1 Tax=Microbacterium sp. KR10-403 TaxID=3158581 RepID=UPI0032E3D9BE
MTDKTLPKHVEIQTDDTGAPLELLVDGEPFPWYLTPGVDLHVKADDEDLSTITVTMYAERVTITPRNEAQP